jgi:hypothetical protein
MEDTPRRYLVIISLDDSSDRVRVSKVIPDIMRTMRDVSEESPETAFRSHDGTLSGIFLYSRSPIRVIRSAFDTSQVTTNKDQCLVLEIAKEVDGTQGFSRSRTWIQRH